MNNRSRIALQNKIMSIVTGGENDPQNNQDSRSIIVSHQINMSTNYKLRFYKNII